MKKMLLLSIVVSLVVLWAVSCGGGGSNAGPATPTGPSTPNPAAQAPVSSAINIVGITGSGAFTPNPAQVPSGGTIVWRNETSAAHALVMNDGTPIGTVAPSGSLTTTLSGSGGNFHCTNHPTMVGSINGATAPPPPTRDGDDYDY